MRLFLELLVVGEKYGRRISSNKIEGITCSGLFRMNNQSANLNTVLQRWIRL